jgi:hypothetical protein
VTLPDRPPSPPSVAVARLALHTNSVLRGIGQESVPSRAFSLGDLRWGSDAVPARNRTARPQTSGEQMSLTHNVVSSRRWVYDQSLSEKKTYAALVSP